MVRFDFELHDESYPPEVADISALETADPDVYIVIRANGRSVQWLNDITWEARYTFHIALHDAVARDLDSLKHRRGLESLLFRVLLTRYL